MNINNVTEFRNFVNANQLRSLSSTIDKVAICVMDYERLCNCWKASDKQRVYNNCNALYTQSVSEISSNFKSQFLAHTIDQSLNFYKDGALIASLRR